MDIIKKLNEVENNFNLLSIETLEDIDKVKIEYLGKKGILNDLAKNMKDLTIEEKREFGKSLNEFKSKVNLILNNKREELENIKLNEKLESERIDISLPSTTISVGSPNILEKLIEELEELFISFGYDVVEGPEVEEDLYNFEMLNLPVGHPARDEQDSFYIEDDKIVLRSQTSPVQVRTMLKNKNKDYVRIVCPGKVYRRDNDDATHSHQFTQMEGLLIGKDISLANLKYTLDKVAYNLFGESITRFRPSHYPFTEPSVEYDVRCFKCKGKGCNICKGTGWITVGGAGMVHPNVLKMSGYDIDKFNGFAFGFGIERLAMLKYGINDVRKFYINDLRELKDFYRREAK